MTQKHQETKLAEKFARRMEGADVEQIATTVTSAMGAIELKLRPIIGQGGVAAMYRRCLVLVGSSHPWVVDSNSLRKELDLATLRSLLLERNPADATSAGGELLQTFSNLLASLVGESLSERLLGNVWSEL